MIAGDVPGGVLQVVAQAATCDADAEFAACHLTRQDWGVPIVVDPAGTDRLPLILRGLDTELAVPVVLLGAVVPGRVHPDLAVAEPAQAAKPPAQPGPRHAVRAGPRLRVRERVVAALHGEHLIDEVQQRLELGRGSIGNRQARPDHVWTMCP